MNETYQAVIPAPFGALGVRTAEGAVTGITYLSSSWVLQDPRDDFTICVCAALQRYLEGPAMAFDLPLNAVGTPFQQRVWQALQTIPLGEAWTYAELAQCVGSGARAVANACGANPIALIIPCHRVVAKQGLGGFMRGRATASLNIKQWLLDHERR